MLGIVRRGEARDIARDAVEQPVDFLLQEREWVGIAAGDGTLGSNRDHGFRIHVYLLVKPYWRDCMLAEGESCSFDEDQTSARDDSDRVHALA